MIDKSAIVDTSQLSVNRLAITGAIVVLIVFAICWITAAFGIIGSHAFVGLFTIAPVQSVAALGMGSLWAVVFGAVAGALIALCYNLTAPRLAR